MWKDWTMNEGHHVLRKNGTFVLADRVFVSKRSIRSEQW